MFKRSLLLGCVLAAAISAGLMGMKGVSDVLERVKDATSPYIASSAEEASAIARLVLVYSSKNVKKCGKTKKVLTDLARIINECLAFYDKAKNYGLAAGCKHSEGKAANYLSLFSLFLSIDDFFALGGDIFGLDEKKYDSNEVVLYDKDGKKYEQKSDPKLKGLIGFFDDKIIPLIEGLASVGRASGKVVEAMKLSHEEGSGKNALVEFATDAKFNWYCTFAIIASRLLPKLVNSEIGSVELKYYFVLTIIACLVVLHDYAPAKFNSVKHGADTLVKAPDNVITKKFWEDTIQNFFAEEEHPIMKN